MNGFIICIFQTNFLRCGFLIGIAILWTLLNQSRIWAITRCFELSTGVDNFQRNTTSGCLLPKVGIPRVILFAPPLLLHQTGLGFHNLKSHMLIRCIMTMNMATQLILRSAEIHVPGATPTSSPRDHDGLRSAALFLMLLNLAKVEGLLRYILIITIARHFFEILKMRLLWSRFMLRWAEIGHWIPEKWLF